MRKITLYHGSNHIIKTPIYGEGKEYNDYGKGFYCTQHIELAKEWACTQNTDGYVNKYEIDTTGLSILKLSSDEYSILHWLALLVNYRKFRISTPLMKLGVDWLLKHFLIDISKYDIIIGYRADDSYFSFAKAFLNNEISLTQLSYAMRLGRLGEQYVLISPKAFDHIKFISYEFADNKVYYAKRKTRDDNARYAYKIELERQDLDSLFIRDIIREEVQPDDPRIR